jgi:hypothetical protein
MHHLGRLPAVGDTVEIALLLDIAAEPLQPKLLAATVKTVRRRVPASIFVSVEADDE